MRPSGTNSEGFSKTKSMVNHLYYEFMVCPTSKYSQKQRNERAPVEEYKSVITSSRYRHKEKEIAEGFNLVQ